MAEFLVRARLVKVATEDGLWATVSNVHKGDLFIIDLYTKATVCLQSKTTHEVVEKEIVQCMETGGWLPVECLELLP